VKEELWMGGKLAHDGEAIFTYDGLQDPHIPTHFRELAQRNMETILASSVTSAKQLNSACAYRLGRPASPVPIPRLPLVMLDEQTIAVV
jgi:hypothetical protein